MLTVPENNDVCTHIQEKVPNREKGHSFYNLDAAGVATVQLLSTQERKCPNAPVMRKRTCNITLSVSVSKRGNNSVRNSVASLSTFSKVISTILGGGNRLQP